MSPMITWCVLFYVFTNSTAHPRAIALIVQPPEDVAQCHSPDALKNPLFHIYIYNYTHWRFKTAMWVWLKLKRPEHVIVSYTKCGSVSPLVIWVQTCSMSISKNGRVTHDFCLVTFTSDLGGWLNHWWFLVFDPRHVWFQQLHVPQKGNLTTETWW